MHEVSPEDITAALSNAPVEDEQPLEVDSMIVVFEAVRGVGVDVDTLRNFLGATVAEGAAVALAKMSPLPPMQEEKFLFRVRFHVPADARVDNRLKRVIAGLQAVEDRIHTMEGHSPVRDVKVAEPIPGLEHLSVDQLRKLFDATLAATRKRRADRARHKAIMG